MSYNIDWTEFDKKHANLICRSVDDGERIYTSSNDDKPVVIEVLGRTQPQVVGGKSQEAQQEIVATLYRSECRLYELLGWRAKRGYQTESFEGPGYNFFAVAGIVFIPTLFIFGLSRMIVPFFAEIRFLFFLFFDGLMASAASLLMSFLIVYFAPWWRKRWARAKIDRWLKASRKKRGDLWVKTLLGGLSLAYHRHIASEAKKALQRNF